MGILFDHKEVISYHRDLRIAYGFNSQGLGIALAKKPEGNR